jgi:NDP-sugar pyrophosphorylase family protein
MKPDRFKKASPIFRWLLFALIFLSQVPVYAAVPSFTTTTTADVKHSSLKLLVETNETGKAYYVVLHSGDAAPSDAQVKDGQDSHGSAVDADKKGVLTLTADTEASSYIIGLMAATAYKIYVVAEDSAAILNTQVVVAVATTAAPGDVTAPVFDDLGNPITAGETTIEFTVKTDEDGTAHYIVLDDNAAVPTDTQIKNGQNDTSTDVDATKKGELTLTANTGSIASVSGLTANAAYDIYVIAEDNEGNVTTGKIDVLLDSIAPEFATGYPKVEDITQTSANLKIQSNETGKAYYVRLDAGAAAPTDVKAEATGPVTLTAGTEASETISSLTAGATYDLYIMIEDDAGNVTTTAASYPLSFTTSLAAGATITGTYDNAGKTITAGTDTITGSTTITGGTLTGSFDFTASGLDVTLKDVIFAAGTSITGGKLEGTITGDANDPVTLTNVQILANATLINVIIGDGVTFEPGVTLENVKFEGLSITLADVTLKGTITIVQTSITIITNVQFGIGFTALSGGTLSGIIKTATGFSGSPSLTGLTFKDVTDFKAVGVSVSGATFQGSFTATSTVVITNVIFGLNFTAFSGGTLSGTIATATGFSGSASLTGLTLLNVTSFTVVSVSVTNVILQGTFTTTSTVTLTNVTIGAGVTITGTKISLAGTIQPITPTTVVNLTNLKIADNSIVLKGVELGSGVTQGTAVQVLTQALTTIPSTITSTTVINNVSIPAGATITGGILGGAIIGNALNPPTLNVTSISAGAILSNVILGANITTLPLNIVLGIGVQFTSLSIISFNFNLTSILPVFRPPVIIGVTLPPILDLSGGLIAGGGSLFNAITPTRTANVFGGGARIKRRKGRLSIKLKAKPGKRPAMCGFRPSSARRRGRRRRAADDANSYGFGNALYITTPDDVEIKNQPSVQNLEALKAKLDTMGYSKFEVKDNGNISVEKDGKIINFRPSITSDEVDASTPLGFKDNKLFEKGVLTTFIFDDVDEEDGTTRREQVLYPAPASFEDITDDSVTILNKNDQDGDSYKEDGEIEFKLGGKTYKGTLDYYVEKGASTRAAGITVTDNSDYFLITYTDGSKQKLFKVVITTPPVQQQPDDSSDGNKADDSSDGNKADDSSDGNKADDSSDGGSTTPPAQQQSDDGKTDPTLEEVEGPITNTGILEDIALAENAVIDGGILQGTITGSADGSGKLNNLEIVANSYVSNVTIGKNVTFGKGVTLKDVVFMGASLSDAILEGIIRVASSATVITNATLKANTKVIGGKLAGIIKGDSTAPALLEFLTIEANSQLTYVIISDGVDIPVDAKLGTGVKFSKAENIPFNVDLTATLPSFTNTIAVDLSADLVVDGKGLLITINALPAFAANNFIMDQSDKSGNLQLKVEGLTFKVLPVKVKRVDPNTTRAADESVRLGFGNTVYFKTDDGIEVESHPVVQDLTTLEALLVAIEIPKIEITKEGNIKVPVTDKLWFSGRAALASEASEAEVGFTFKGDLVVLVFEDKDGQKRQQVLYPAPASNAVIQLTEEASLTEEGILSFKVGETAYKGKLDYAVEKGEVTENSGVTEIADSNGDGLPDFLITYPKGDKQKLFALPEEEAATE